jgi:hypothetical protein
LDHRVGWVERSEIQHFVFVGFRSSTQPTFHALAEIMIKAETRMHVHIHSENGEAKFWLEPEIELAKNYRLSRLELRQIENIIEEHYDSFTAAWQRHFGG